MISDDVFDRYHGLNYIDGKFTTLTKCCPNVVFLTNMDTEVRSVKCTLAQILLVSNNVVQPPPTLPPTANVGPTQSCYLG